MPLGGWSVNLGDLHPLLARGRFVSVLEAGTRIGRDERRGLNERVQALLLACHAAKRLELSARQAELAAEALSLATDTVDVAQATVAAGVAATRLGDPYEGERHLLSALGMPLPNQLRAAAYYNLGRTYEQMRRYESAVMCYQEAARLFGSEHAPMVVMAHQQAAWVLLVTNDLTAAYKHLAKAAAFIEPSDARRQADHLARSCGYHTPRRGHISEVWSAYGRRRTSTYCSRPGAVTDPAKTHCPDIQASVFTSPAAGGPSTCVDRVDVLNR